MLRFVLRFVLRHSATLFSLAHFRNRSVKVKHRLFKNKRTHNRTPQKQKAHAEIAMSLYGADAVFLPSQLLVMIPSL